MTVTEIAAELGIGQIDVTRLVRVWSLTKIDMAAQDRVRLRKSMEVSRVRYVSLVNPIKDEEHLSVIEKAYRILQNRLVEKNGTYFLDGRAATIWEVCCAAGIDPRG